MPSQPHDGGQSVALTPRMKLHLGDNWQGSAQLAPPAAAVLGGDDSFDATAGLSVFSAAEPAIELDVQAPPDAVLGGEAPQTSTLEYEPEEEAAYALLQAIQTPDGTIYDFTLPEPRVDEGDMVLGGGATTLRFPVNPIALDLGGGQAPEGAVLGFEDVVGGVVGGTVGGVIVKRVIQVIKSPFEKSLHEAIRRSEGDPWVGALRGDVFQPVQGFESWRALLPPGGERRVLLFVHGFASSLGSSNEWLAELGKNHDVVLGFDHPTIWCDPEQNARMLLEMIPDDLRLSVDIVAHSRGGLVSRSLVELVEPREQFNVRRIITNGTPHGGTRLADPERWDRLVSIGMTAASWLAATAGAAVWIPKAIELVLKAASQIVFDLPGVGAMTPNGDFIKKLNTTGDLNTFAGRAQGTVRYSAISSRFSIFGAPNPAFRQALNTFAAQAFFDAPNDLVVPTESMTMIDQSGLVPKERQLLAGLDHFSYFRDRQVIDFIARQLAED